jgi:hypothetical protein
MGGSEGEEQSVGISEFGSLASVEFPMSTVERGICTGELYVPNKIT